MSATTPAIAVRPASPGDLGAVRRLLAEAKLPLDGLEDQFGAGFAVADAGGDVVAAEGIELHGDSGLLRSAVVAPAWRGHGVGERLTRDRLAWARGRGVREVWLLTTTAAAYFPRFGFRTARREDAPAALRESLEFREACPASAVAMRLSL